MGLGHCRVVLVRPYYPGNLGAIARVMRNMGLSELVLANPRALPTDPEARQMATTGLEILEKARIVASLEEAVRDCVLVLATSGRIGGLFRKQNVLPPREAIPQAVEVLAQARTAALVFGPEPMGLSNDEISHCQCLVHIPADPDSSALNLAQAAAICLYELRLAWEGRNVPSSASDRDFADVASQEILFHQLQSALEAIHFLYGPKAESLMHAVRHILGKARLTPQEVQILFGITRQIHWLARQKLGE